MSALREELDNDPLGIGYASMTDADIEASLNEKRYPVIGKLPVDDFIATLYETGVFDAMFDAAEAGNADVAKEIKRLQVLKGFGINNLDLASVSVVGRLRASGIPGPVVDSLIVQATTYKSRAEVLGLPEVKLT